MLFRHADLTSVGVDDRMHTLPEYYVQGEEEGETMLHRLVIALPIGRVASLCPVPVTKTGSSGNFSVDGMHASVKSRPNCLQDAHGGISE